MKILALLIAVGWLAGCASAPSSDNNWSSADSKRQFALYAAAAGDAITTSRIQYNNFTNPLEETGPIAHIFLGDLPNDAQIVAYYAAAAFTYHYIARRLPPKWRKVFQYVMIYDHAVLGIVNNCDEGLC